MVSKKENIREISAGIIGQNIERLRRAACLSRKELARLMGISYQQLYKYERGQNIISAEALVYLKFCLSAENYDEFFAGLF